jgi:hypothetical protein
VPLRCVCRHTLASLSASTSGVISNQKIRSSGCPQRRVTASVADPVVGLGSRKNRDGERTIRMGTNTVKRHLHESVARAFARIRGWILDVRSQSICPAL